MSDEKYSDTLSALGASLSGLVIGALAALPISFVLQNDLAKNAHSFTAYVSRAFRYLLLELSGQNPWRYLAFTADTSILYRTLLAGAMLGGLVGGYRLIPLLLRRENGTVKAELSPIVSACAIILALALAESTILFAYAEPRVTMANICLSALLVLIVGFASDHLPDPFAFRALGITFIAPVTGLLLFLLRGESASLGVVLLSLAMIGILKGLAQPLMADLAPRGQRSIVAACFAFSGAPSAWFLYRGEHWQQISRGRIDVLLLAGLALLVLATAAASALRHTSDNRELETYDDEPVARNRTIWRLLLVAFASGLFSGVMIQKVYGFGIHVLSLKKDVAMEAHISPSALSAVISVIVGGLLVRYVSPRATLALSFVLLAIGSAIGALANGLAGYVAMIVCVVAFSAIVGVTLLPELFDHTASAEYGLANGLTAMALTLGHLFPQLAHNYLAFSDRLLLCLLSIFAIAIAALAAKKERPQPSLGAPTIEAPYTA